MRILVALTAALLGVAAIACSDAAAPPAPGALELSASTTGIDPDSDGYVVRLDSGATHLLTADGSVTIPGVSPGSHVIGLSGVAANCAVGGGAQRAVTVSSGDTARIAFDVSCNPVIHGSGALAGVWDWTEHFDDPTDGATCDDTGSYVFVVAGAGFTGTSDQVGACATPDGVLDNTLLSIPVENGTVTDAGMQFVVGSNGDCRYSAALSGSTDRLSGTATCGTSNGTWTAVRGLSLSSLDVTPLQATVPLDGALQLTVALRNSLGNRVFERPILWSNDGPAVASIDAQGLVRALGAGTAHIGASAAGLSGTTAITVGGTIVIDSVGDTYGDSSVDPLIDIRALAAVGDSSDVTVAIRFAAQLATALYGYLDLDTDQNPATGAEAYVDVWRPDSGGASGLGDELVCDISSGDLYDAVSGAWITTVPLLYDGETNTLVVRLPVSVVGSMRANLAVVVGNEYGPTDLVPNEGNLSMGAAAPSPVAVTAPAMRGAPRPWRQPARMAAVRRPRRGKIP